MVHRQYTLAHCFGSVQSLYEPKQHKPWFDEGCSELLDHRKQAKLQWLQDASEINAQNMNNVRHETSRHFRNIKGNIRKAKLMSLR
jgi:hypothetical protein